MTSLSTLPALDFWWHIKAGQVILETGAIPVKDIFSFTAAGHPYFLQNWLAEVLLYLVYRAGGPPLVIFFHTLLLIGTALPVYLLAVRRASAIQNAALAACLAVIPLALHSHIRPQAFSFLLFAWFWFVLAEFRSRRTRMLWLLPVLMVAWVNLHGAFVLGIVLILLFIVLDVAARLFHESECFTSLEIRKVVSALVLTCAATLVNPQFLGIYDYVVTTVWHPVALARVTEWQSPDIRSFGDVVRFFAPFFLTTFILIRSKAKPRVEDVGILLAFAVFALTARRNGAWFAMIAGPVIAAYLDLRIGSRADRVEKRKLNLVIAAVLVVCTLLSLPWIQQQLTDQSPERLFLDPSLPLGAANFIEARQLKGHIFHPQSYGDYLIWRLWPAQRTFIDGRVPIFSRELARDYFDILDARPDWELRTQRYGIQYLLLDRNAADQEKLVEAAKKTGWHVLFEDERSVLFTKSRTEAGS